MDRVADCAFEALPSNALPTAVRLTAADTMSLKFPFLEV